ncbi:MAG: hypothetical protein U9O83_00680 [Campylobacterota bacterium]|nr:hypothetical protein [Campylobacterota bacterium]
MIKKVLSITLISTMLLFTGCGGDSEGESRLDTQQKLDSGDFAAVIAKLEPKTSKTLEDYLALGAAYMGKAGLSFSDLVEVVAASSEDSNDDGFASFIKNIDNRKSPSALKDLEESAKNYQQVVKTACADAAADPNFELSDTQKDICLYIGLSHSMKVATAFSYLGDVTKLSESGSDDELKASACAMGYAYDGSVGTGCTISEDVNITFSVSEKTYTPLGVTVNSVEYDYLMTGVIPGTTNKQTALTDGYCTLDSFSTRADDEFAGSYACPVNEEKGADDLTAASILVDTLNTGVDSIIAAAGGDDSDMSDDIKEFKEEIKGSAGEEDVTLSEIIDYINTKNQ